METFPILDLPPELRAKVYNFLPESDLPFLRQAAPLFDSEVDRYYEFSVNVYDISSLIQLRPRLIREARVWKLTDQLFSGETCPPLFLHPGYLKDLTITGPVSLTNLRKLLEEVAGSLERLTFTRRANYPLGLGPLSSELKELKFLRINCDGPMKKGDKLPLAGEMFPKLRDFQIMKRYRRDQYKDFLGELLTFISRHSGTLRRLEVDFLPLSCDVDGEDDEEIPGPLDQGCDPADPLLHLEEGALDLLKRSLSLTKLSMTVSGKSWKEMTFWADLLAGHKLNSLRELRFDNGRKGGFPWRLFAPPVQRSGASLKVVELANLGIAESDPLDLDVMRECVNLKVLILRCREREEPEDLQDKPLLINLSSLPQSLETLELFRLKIRTEELQLLSLPFTERLFLHESGRRGALGVTSGVLLNLARDEWKRLRFLEVIGFNPAGPLEEMFEKLGKHWEGEDSWLEYCDASRNANQDLSILLS